MKNLFKSKPLWAISLFDKFQSASLYFLSILNLDLGAVYNKARHFWLMKQPCPELGSVMFLIGLSAKFSSGNFVC